MDLFLNCFKYSLNLLLNELVFKFNTTLFVVKGRPIWGDFVSCSSCVPRPLFMWSFKISVWFAKATAAVSEMLVIRSETQDFQAHKAEVVSNADSIHSITDLIFHKVPQSCRCDVDKRDKI